MVSSDQIIELIKEINIAQIFVILLGMWFFYRRIENKIDKLEKRIDIVDGDIKELRTSLNRMEGAFYSKECCMLKSDEQRKKID